MHGPREEEDVQSDCALPAGVAPERLVTAESEVLADYQNRFRSAGSVQAIPC